MNKIISLLILHFLQPSFAQSPDDSSTYGLIAVSVLSVLILAVITIVFFRRSERMLPTLESVQDLQDASRDFSYFHSARGVFHRQKEALLKDNYSVQIAFRVFGRIIMVWDIVSDWLITKLLLRHGSGWANFMLFTIFFSYGATMVIFIPIVWEYFKNRSVRPVWPTVLFTTYAIPAMIACDGYLVLSAPFRAPEKWFLLYSHTRLFCEVLFESVPQSFFQGWILLHPTALPEIARNELLFGISVAASLINIFRALFYMKEFHYLSTKLHVRIRPYVATIRSNASRTCSISHFQVSYRELEIICHQINQYSYSIKDFRFEKLKLTADDCVPIGSLFIKNASVKSLSLNNNTISDVGLQRLCRSLSSDTTLRTLSIDNNNISDNGVYHLVVLVKQGNCRISNLSLRNNLIGQGGVQELIEVSKIQPRIAGIRISGNNNVPKQLMKYLKIQLADNTKFQSYNFHRAEYFKQQIPHEMWVLKALNKKPLDELFSQRVFEEEKWGDYN